MMNCSKKMLTKKIQCRSVFYFTPRPLIDVIVKLMKPQAGELCNDLVCKTDCLKLGELEKLTVDDSLFY